MSDKAYCPACDAATSNITAGFRERGECPHCGLSAAVAEEIAAAVIRGADAKLAQMAAKAEQRAQASEAKARFVAAQLKRVQTMIAEIK